MQLPTTLSIVCLLLGLTSLLAIALFLDPQPTSALQLAYVDKTTAITGNAVVEQARNGLVTGHINGTCNTPFLYFGRQSDLQGTRFIGTPHKEGRDLTFWIEEIK